MAPTATKKMKMGYRSPHTGQLSFPEPSRVGGRRQRPPFSCSSLKEKQLAPAGLTPLRSGEQQGEGRAGERGRMCPSPIRTEAVSPMDFMPLFSGAVQLCGVRTSGPMAVTCWGTRGKKGLSMGLHPTGRDQPQL